MKGLFRSFNDKDGKYYYFFMGRYYSDSECKKCVSERICSEFDWGKSSQCLNIQDIDGSLIFDRDTLQKVEEDYIKWEEDGYPENMPLIYTTIDKATIDRFPVYWLQNESSGYEGEDLQDSRNWKIVNV